MTANRRRFVILRHTPGSRGSRGPNRASPVPPHFDWMFEVGGILKTWATEPIESFQQELMIPVEKLADHRLRYLDFEGEIGGDRGTVRRVLAGDYHTIQDAADRFVADLRWIDPEGTARTQRVQIGLERLRLSTVPAATERP
ncbi:MAG: hypothetical protein ACF788_00950 [Novipirellula sp. JB048]